MTLSRRISDQRRRGSNGMNQQVMSLGSQQVEDSLGLC